MNENLNEINETIVEETTTAEGIQEQPAADTQPDTAEIPDIDIPQEEEEIIVPKDWSEWDEHEFTEGETFTGEYPPQAAIWCNKGGTHHLEEIDPDEEGNKRFQIVKNPEITAEDRTKDFYNNFVVTSWGAFRKTPKGYSSAVEAVNTIFNMVNVAQAFTEQLAQLLIFYEVPDFTDAEQCTEEWLVAHQKTHEACDLQTFMQWYLEFQTVWASTQYTDIPVPQMEL